MRGKVSSGGFLLPPWWNNEATFYTRCRQFQQHIGVVGSKTRGNERRAEEVAYNVRNLYSAEPARTRTNRFSMETGPRWDEKAFLRQ